MVTSKKSQGRANTTRSSKKRGSSSVRTVINEYRLSGPQVEPESSYWTDCRPTQPGTTPCQPCVVPRPLTLSEIKAGTSIPAFPTNVDEINAEFRELQDLERRRDDPMMVTSTEPRRERLPISTFLQLRPPPLRGGGGINMARQDSFPVLFTGAELARYFENNTPGLAHRQALNYLIHDTNWSPPRQALVWAALDVTIYSALVAAWYYKWLSPRGISRRQRPIEFAIDNGRTLNVLYDRPPNSTGSDTLEDIVAFAFNPDRLVRNGQRPDFLPAVTGFINTSPGTPRHPAYPSGHSTYGAAASELLSLFFPDYRRELDFLADNTGVARLWAGIHWRTDHTYGMQLGRQIACLVIEQLRRSGIPLVPPRREQNETPPTRAQLQTQADTFAANCGQAPPGAVPGLLQPVSQPCVTPGERGADTDVDTSDTKGESFVG
jgi:membrane-associated phospholipid phosphatase